MKRWFIILIFIIALGMISSLPSVAAPGHYSRGYGSRYSPYAYNPTPGGPSSSYNPYVYDPIYPLQNQVIQDPTQQRSSYEWGDVTKYPIIRWYESPEKYRQVYERFGEEPKTLTSPYRDVKKPYSSQVLTSPYGE